MSQSDDDALDARLAKRERKSRRAETMRMLRGVLSVPAASVRMTYRGGWLSDSFLLRLDYLLAISLLPDDEQLAIEARLCWPPASWADIGRALGCDERAALDAWARAVDAVRARILWGPGDDEARVYLPKQQPAWYLSLTAPSWAMQDNRTGRP